MQIMVFSLNGLFVFFDTCEWLSGLWNRLQLLVIEDQRSNFIVNHFIGILVLDFEASLAQVRSV